MDRSIEIPMQRKKDEKVERLRRRDNDEPATHLSSNRMEAAARTDQASEQRNCHSGD
jgi:hypothetical protein